MQDLLSLLSREGLKCTTTGVSVKVDTDIKNYNMDLNKLKELNTTAESVLQGLQNVPNVISVLPVVHLNTFS
ncbi:hypothetical protein CDAR_536361 [Caerostris darwini]|uniref:Uncharacterized protein n=1 Tax=Caerostris darwini TaxID=1538125 RepID=A0AAV4MRS3_9ARAC|nr:hypothetical protein CDAR_536361 [Caerostris darwini]